MSKSKNIVFLHPDLGIGGAERLVIDAAVALTTKGHKVTIYTSYFNPKRCFDEARDGTFNVVVAGNWIPRHIFGGFHILLALMRALWLSLWVSFSFVKADMFVCDQISLYVFVLRLCRPFTGILFYCHFPDLLLSKRTSLLKRLYRIGFDVVEEACTGCADLILVNSRFTLGVFKDTFKCLRVVPDVLYPCVDVPKEVPPPPKRDPRVVFLSINRYERKKHIELAVGAMRILRSLVTTEEFSTVELIVAGGYDERVEENVSYHEELVDMAADGDLIHCDSPQVTFIKSFSDAEKAELLKRCSAVVYTPENEHFGIVPIEAMCGARAVIAQDSGGPRESVAHNSTGFLCDPTPESFAEAMAEIVKHPDKAAKMGVNGRERVERLFARQVFMEHLSAHCHAVLRKPVVSRALFALVLWVLFALMMCTVAIACSAVAPHVGYPAT